MNLRQGPADLDLEDDELLEVGLKIRQQIDGSAFRNRPDANPSVGVRQGTESEGHKFLAEAQRTLVLGAPNRVLAKTLFGPKELVDCIVECLHAPFDRGITRELSKSVVVEEGRRSPDTD